MPAHRRRLGVPTDPLQQAPVAGQVTDRARASTGQVAVDRHGLLLPTPDLQGVGQLVRRLRSQRPGRRVVTHGFLTPRG